MNADKKTQIGTDKGFTLMELLIAVSIFAIIALCLYSVFSGGIGIWRRQEKAFKYSHSVRLALDNMAKEVRNAINYSLPQGSTPPAEGEGELKFSGDEKKLTFMTVIGEDIAKVEYLFEAGQKRLTRKVSFQKYGFQDDENKKETILIEGLEDLTFEYTARAIANTEDAKPDWQNTWPKEAASQAPKIPIGVRITLTFREQDQEKPEILKKTVFIPMGSLEESAR